MLIGTLGLGGFSGSGECIGIERGLQGRESGIDPTRLATGDTLPALPTLNSSHLLWLSTVPVLSRGHFCSNLSSGWLS